MQLFITTHSLECVRAILDGARNAQSEGAVFHLSLEDGELRVRKIAADAVVSLSEVGTDVRNLDLYA